MTRKKRIGINDCFTLLPMDITFYLLQWDDRFYISNEGKIISRFSKMDYRYVLLSKIPRFSCIWNFYYSNGNAISYQIYIAFLSKNKKNRFSLSYYDDETDVRKIVFRNHRSFEECMFFL